MRVLVLILVAAMACWATSPSSYAEPFHRDNTLSITPIPDLIMKGEQSPKKGKRILRVLLFGPPPTREFHFVRSILFRRDKGHRIEPTIVLPKDLEIPREFGDRIVQFPTHLVRPKRKDKLPGLAEFDVIVAIDPDWSQLSDQQWLLLRRWVAGTTGGGLIIVAGPTHAHQLAKRDQKRREKAFHALTKMLPVSLHDARESGRVPKYNTTRPWTLTFSKAARSYDFLNISRNKKAPLKGWQDYFWEGGKPKPGKEPFYGFYTYYPVKAVHPKTVVLASFNGPKATWMTKKQRQPWIAVRSVGAGKTAYVGSGELWRLRRYDSASHERFWLGLINYVGQGAAGKKASSE
ncbi:MAG: hypothetical protein ACFCD0_00885 [Gemmataceae bacterium]